MDPALTANDDYTAKQDKGSTVVCNRIKTRSPSPGFPVASHYGHFTVEGVPPFEIAYLEFCDKIMFIVTQTNKVGSMIISTPIKTVSRAFLPRPEVKSYYLLGDPTNIVTEFFCTRIAEIVLMKRPGETRQIITTLSLQELPRSHLDSVPVAELISDRDRLQLAAIVSACSQMLGA